MSKKMKLLDSPSIYKDIKTWNGLRKKKSGQYSITSHKLDFQKRNSYNKMLNKRPKKIRLSELRGCISQKKISLPSFIPCSHTKSQSKLTAEGTMPRRKVDFHQTASKLARNKSLIGGSQSKTKFQSQTTSSSRKFNKYRRTPNSSFLVALDSLPSGGQSPPNYQSKFQILRSHLGSKI